MRKNLTRIVAATMLTVILAGTGNKLVSANNDYNGNYHDRVINIYYEGDGSDIYTTSARKYNNTPTYVKSKSINWYVMVVNANNNAFLRNSYAYVPRGKDCFLYTNGKKNDSIRLAISPEKHSPCTVSGVWSPDSINYQNKCK